MGGGGDHCLYIQMAVAVCGILTMPRVCADRVAVHADDCHCYLHIILCQVVGTASYKLRPILP